MDHCSPYSNLLFQRSLSCVGGSCVSCLRRTSRQDLTSPTRTQNTTLAPNGWAHCSSSYQRAHVFLMGLNHCRLPSGGGMTPSVRSLGCYSWPATAWQSYAFVAVAASHFTGPRLFGTIARRRTSRSALVSEKGGARRGVSWATSDAAGYHTGSYVGVSGDLRIDQQDCLVLHHAAGAAEQERNGEGIGRSEPFATTFNASWMRPRNLFPLSTTLERGYPSPTWTLSSSG